MKNTKPVTSYQLKITLDNVKPTIWRRVLVPSTIRLPHLHIVIQEVMGWENYHLYAFRVGEFAY